MNRRELTIVALCARREQVVRRPGAPSEEQQVPSGECAGPGGQRVGVAQQPAEQCIQHTRAAPRAHDGPRSQSHTHDAPSSSQSRGHDTAPSARDAVTALVVPRPPDQSHAAPSPASAGRADAAGRDDTPERVLLRPLRARANTEGNQGKGDSKCTLRTFEFFAFHPGDPRVFRSLDHPKERSKRTKLLNLGNLKVPQTLR